MKAKRIIYLIAFLLVSTSLSAQSISIQVSADQVSVGESFLVSYTLEGNVEDFKLPELKDFKVYQSGKSTNMSIINGKVSRSVSYNITVVPLSAGTYEIAPAKAVINGKKVSSPPFTIEVLNDSQKPRSQQRQQGQSSSPQTSQRIDPPSDNWKDNIFLIAEVDKKQMYVGEQVTITYKLMRRLDFQTMEVEKLPVFRGFLSEEMEIPTHQAEGITEYKGQRFYYQAFRKVALFASQTGVQTIDPLIARGVILIPDRDPFYGTTLFSSASPKMVVISSNALKIEVLPLPKENQPKNFSGAVGQFQASRELSTTDIAQGQSATMSIDVSGWGNLKAISPLQIQTGSSLEIFEPEIFDNPKKNGEIYGGTRTFNYAVVPHKTGNIVLPAYEFVYFDPVQKNYITKELPEVTLNVTPGQAVDEESTNKGQHFQAQLKNGLPENSPDAHLPVAVALVSGFPVLALIGLLVWRRRKSQNASSSAVQVFSWPDMEALPEQKKYSALAQALRLRLKQQLNISGSSDTEILGAIPDAGIQQKIAFVLHSCDRAAYSPMQSTSVQELKNLAEDACSRIQKSEAVS